MTENAQTNDIYQDKDGNMWFVTSRTVKPVIAMEQLAMPGQKASMMKSKIGELGSETWNGFHKIGRKMGKREKTDFKKPIVTEKSKSKED
jgi:hypothetical protein